MMLTSPSPCDIASSQASEILPSCPGFTTILSITISIVCLKVFSSFISSSSSKKVSPSILTRLKPSFLIFSITFSCSPFLPLTTGAKTRSFVPSSNSIIASTIWSTDWLVISFPQIGQCGLPILAYSSLR